MQGQGEKLDIIVIGMMVVLYEYDTIIKAVKISNHCQAYIRYKSIIIAVSWPFIIIIAHLPTTAV